MNLQQIEAIENKLIKNVLLTGWNLVAEMDGNTEYGCDLVNTLFKSNHYTYAIPQTEQDTADLGVWDCLQLVHNYEQWNFGELNTKLEPFAVANMVNYILGSSLFNESEHLRSEAWDDYLTEEDLEAIQAELRAYIEGLTDWKQFWTEVCDGYDV